MNATLVLVEYIALAAFVGYLVLALLILFVRKAYSIYRFGPFFIFFIFIFGSSIPTPGSWSDVRSQWLPTVLIFLLLVAIGVIGFFSTFRGRLIIERICGISGLLLFTLWMPSVLAGLMSHYLFFEDVRRAHETWK